MPAARHLLSPTSTLLRSSSTASHVPSILMLSRLPSHRPTTHHSRPLSTTLTRPASSNPNPQRDAQQDREKINTDANEYAKSGTDDTAAGQEEAAFDPNITDPQEAKEKAGEGNKVNPLDASPANPEISQGTSEVEGGAGEKKKTPRESQ